MKFFWFYLVYCTLYNSVHPIDYIPFQIHFSSYESGIFLANVIKKQRAAIHVYSKLHQIHLFNYTAAFQQIKFQRSTFCCVQIINLSVPRRSVCMKLQNYCFNDKQFSLCACAPGYIVGQNNYEIVCGTQLI